MPCLIDRCVRFSVVHSTHSASLISIGNQCCCKPPTGSRSRYRHGTRKHLQTPPSRGSGHSRMGGRVSRWEKAPSSTMAPPRSAEDPGWCKPYAAIPLRFKKGVASSVCEWLTRENTRPQIALPCRSAVRRPHSALSISKPLPPRHLAQVNELQNGR